jgi:hypothetical protein
MLILAFSDPDLDPVPNVRIRPDLDPQHCSRSPTQILKDGMQLRFG